MTVDLSRGTGLILGSDVRVPDSGSPRRVSGPYRTTDGDLHLTGTCPTPTRGTTSTENRYETKDLGGWSVLILDQIKAPRSLEGPMSSLRKREV